MSDFLTFPVPVTISLNQEQLEKAQKAINLHHLGDEQVNTLDEKGRLVAKYPDRETQELRDAHRRINMVRTVNLLVQVSMNGDITVVGAKQ